jgi:glyoxylase-like metal-dependent hydrolase (beta-lactamase superfamily II)
MRRWLALGVLIAAGGTSIAVSGYQGQQQRPALPDPVKVKDNLYVIGSSSPADNFTGGNTGVFITDAGVVVVDTKLSGYGQALLDKIKTVTPKPVTTIINTHTHGDHTGSNEGFPTSVEIVTHDNTKVNMEKMDAFKGDKAKFLPKRTFSSTLTLGSGKDRVELFYFGAGHTNGDTLILYPELRVLQTGDMFPWKDAPFIDRGNGGSGVALPSSLGKLLSGVKGFDTVIPGHIPVTTRLDLEEFQRFNADVLAATQAAVKGGQPADAALTAVNAVTAKYKGYKTERTKALVEAIYAELKP